MKLFIVLFRGMLVYIYYLNSNRCSGIAKYLAALLSMVVSYHRYCQICNVLS